MAGSKQVEPYSITPAFERAVVTLACTVPRFFGTVGHALDPEAMPSAPAKLAMEAARAISKDLGHGPDGTLLVIQRLRSWQHDGKVSHEQVVSVAELFDAAEDAGLPPEDSAVAELAPLLRRRMQQEAVRAAMNDYSKKGDFAQVVSLVTKADRLGVTDTSVGTLLGNASFKVIEGLRFLERLPTGVLELDSALGGGIPRAQLPVFIGGPGDGKSMMLSHMAARATQCGLFTGYATLELGDAEVLCRIKANLTGETIDSIKMGSEKARALVTGMSLGPCLVKSFTAMATTVQDLKAWVVESEAQLGRKMDLLLVDYADKLGTLFRQKETSGYLSMLEVYESLRLLLIERNMWGATASQSTGRNKTSDQKKRKKTDLGDVADSIHKVRVADIVIALDGLDEGTLMEFFIAKHRTGKGRVRVGPLPTDFACGAIAPVMRPEGGGMLPLDTPVPDEVSRILGG